MLENGLGPLDIPNDDVPAEPKPDPELTLVLLLLVAGPNKLSNSLSAAYLSPIVAELPDADTSGPNPALDVAGGCDGAVIKKEKTCSTHGKDGN